MSDSKLLGKVVIKEIKDNNDGTCTLDLEFPDELKENLKASLGWKRWSSKKFNQFFLEALTKHAKEEPAFYPAEMKSDQDLELTISELIREAVITELFEEVPHSIAVVIDELSKREEKDLVDIHASIIVERDSQKGIIIGSKGAHLKDIGIRARKEIEKKLGSKIFLALHVKVIPNWQTDAKALAKLGLLSN